MENIKLSAIETIEINGIEVKYGRLPSGLVQSYEGIVFFFKTREAYDADTHERAVQTLISKIESESDNHGSSWEMVKCEATVWKERNQITVASFRVRDIY